MAPGWTQNPNPQPGDFMLRSDDGLLVTLFDGQTGAVVSRRDRPPSLADLSRVRRELLGRPAVAEVPEVLKPGGSRDHAVTMRAGPNLAVCLLGAPSGPAMKEPQVTGLQATAVDENSARDAWRGLKLGIQRLLTLAEKKRRPWEGSPMTPEEILQDQALAMEMVYRASKVFGSAKSLVGAVTSQVVLDLLRAVQEGMTVEDAARLIMGHVLAMEPDLATELSLESVWEWWKDLVTLPPSGTPPGE